MLQRLWSQCHSDIIKDFEKDPLSILRFIDLGTYMFDKYSIIDENTPVINLGVIVHGQEMKG